MSGIERIAAERARQVEMEGWTSEHDDEHTEDGLALAASVYAIPDRRRNYGRVVVSASENGGRDLTEARVAGWPWGIEWFKPSPDDRIRELVKAGALIAAEIDRLERKSIG